jgi:hypothetical protein
MKNTTGMNECKTCMKWKRGQREKKKSFGVQEKAGLTEKKK